MSTETENKKLKKQIAQELSEYNATYDINFDIIGEDILNSAKDSLDKVNELIKNNPIKDLTEEKELEIYKEMTKYGRDLKDEINNLKVNFKLMGTQAKEVNKIIKNATYNPETLFWGIKIEQNILNKIDKSKLKSEDIQIIECSIMELVMLHTILMSAPIIGLTFESYLIAKTTIDITEFVKAYNFLNIQADKIVNAIKEWENTQYKPELN